MPVRTSDGNKRADLIYESMQEKISLHNSMIIIELKKDKIETAIMVIFENDNLWK